MYRKRGWISNRTRTRHSCFFTGGLDAFWRCYLNRIFYRVYIRSLMLDLKPQKRCSLIIYHNVNRKTSINILWFLLYPSNFSPSACFMIIISLYLSVESFRKNYFPKQLCEAGRLEDEHNMFKKEEERKRGKKWIEKKRDSSERKVEYYGCVTQGAAAHSTERERTAHGTFTQSILVKRLKTYNENCNSSSDIQKKWLNYSSWSQAMDTFFWLFVSVRAGVVCTINGDRALWPAFPSRRHFFIFVHFVMVYKWPSYLCDR